MESNLVSIFIEICTNESCQKTSYCRFLADHSYLKIEQVEYIELEPWCLYTDNSKHQGSVEVGILIIF